MAKKYTYGLLFLLFFIISIALYKYKIYYYLIVTGTLAIISLVAFILSKNTKTMSDEEIYNYELKKILKFYKNLLVETNNLPNLKNKSILKTQTFEDLLDAQSDSDNPIYYLAKEDSTIFYIINGEIFLMYLIKPNKNEMSSLDIKVKENELVNCNDLDKVKDFDKTIVINTNKKAIKISPIREK